MTSELMTSLFQREASEPFIVWRSDPCGQPGWYKLLSFFPAGLQIRSEMSTDGA